MWSPAVAVVIQFKATLTAGVASVPVLHTGVNEPASHVATAAASVMNER